MRMLNLWFVLNSILVVLGFWNGYRSMSPDRLRHYNPEPVLCVVLLLVMSLFAVLSVKFSLQRLGSRPLLRPSWNRNPLNWRRDPLQSLLVLTCMMFAMTIGSAVQHPGFGSAGFWMLCAYACFAAGLLAGQILVYRIYRQQITSS